jgi:hypothetical protein
MEGNLNAASPATIAETEPQPLYLDLGCGKNPRVDKDAAGKIIKEFEGVDRINFGQKHVIDLRQKWPWADESVDEVWSSHFFEHLEQAERVHFINELYRILKWGAKASIVVPSGSNACAYGDPTHKWPPMFDWAANYWWKQWRDANAPHADAANDPVFGYSCDFDFVIGWSPDGNIAAFNQERQLYMVRHDWNAARDLWFNLTKTKR